MKKLILLFLIGGALYAQDMRQNAFSSLFSDQKAFRIGDAITIEVVESSQASNNAQTSGGRSSDIGFSGSGMLDNTALPSADLGLNSANEFQGSGATKTTGMIRTKISATIDSVLTNGNLYIRGSRKISINGEEQLIHLSGIVRISDIRADNSVLSYNISEAEIVLEGNGLIDNYQHPGWLTKLFHWLF